MKEFWSVIEYLKGRVESLTKLVALLVLLFSTTTETVQGWVHTLVGTKAITKEFLKFKEDTTNSLDSITAQIRHLRGDFVVAIYDDNQSWIYPDCRIGGECTARFAVRRTLYGKECDAPDLSPKVRNHGGRKLAAEGLTGGVRVGADEWNYLDVDFIAPGAALPGRGTFWIELEYQCPDGTRRESSTKLPFELLPRM